jgi:sulfide:quinone oxidoreductase
VAYLPSPDTVWVQPHGVALKPAWVVALPRIEGPAVLGLPGGAPHGFIPVDRSCCVPRTGGRVFAAGDATAFPVKHGGLGAQQAGVAAAAIARLAGVPGEEPLFEPEIRGKLLTGHRPLYLRASLRGMQGLESEVFERPPWGSEDKILAPELGAYTAGRRAPA